MLRFIVQTKRKYQKKNQPKRNDEHEEDKNANHIRSDDWTAEGGSSNTDCDQDSDISSEKDFDEEIDMWENEDEDWIEYMKRSTATAVERMKAAQIHAELRHRKNWMVFGNENCIATRWTMGKESSKMNGILKPE